MGLKRVKRVNKNELTTIFAKDKNNILKNRMDENIIINLLSIKI